MEFAVSLLLRVSLSVYVWYRKGAGWKSVVSRLVYMYVIVHSAFIDSVPKWTERGAALRCSGAQRYFESICN